MEQVIEGVSGRSGQRSTANRRNQFNLQSESRSQNFSNSQNGSRYNAQSNGQGVNIGQAPTASLMSSGNRRNIAHQNNQRGINLADSGRAVDYANEHPSILNVEGSILEEVHEDSSRNDGSHTIEELQRIQAEDETDDEFENAS